MADEIDQASDREQLDRDLAIAAAKHSAPELPACGECYNCTASLPPGVRYCDKDCRDDHAKTTSAEIRRGSRE